MKKFILTSVFLFLVSICRAQQLTTYLNFETTYGKFKIKLFTEQIPFTTSRIKQLVNEEFYNGIIFHRVIDGFVIQAGDPTGTGEGGSGVTIKYEFSNDLKYDKEGMVGMANAGPNTNDSQFFITLKAVPHLDGKYTIFGEVVKGMDVVTQISKAKTNRNDRPIEDIKIIKVEVLENFTY